MRDFPMISLLRLRILFILLLFSVPSHGAVMKLGELDAIEAFVTNTLTVIGNSIVQGSNDCFRIGTNVNPLRGSGERNTFIGASVADRYRQDTNAGVSVSFGLSGCDNVGIGAFVMRNLTNAFNTTGSANGGYRNVCVGSKAGENISNGVANIFLGYSSGHTLQSGYNNIGIGDGALFTVDGTNSIGNVGVGIEAGLCITNATYNTLYGYHAGYGQFGGGPGTASFGSPGSYNTYIGAHAGGQMTTNVVGHSNTVAVGYAAGFSGGSQCTYLGYYAGRNNTNDSNVVIVDGLARTDYFTEKTDSLIYGRLNAAVQASQTMRVNAGTVLVSGNLYTTGSNGVANAAAGGTIAIVSTPVASAGASETNLITYAVPANTLTNLNDRLRFRFAGNFAATANSKDLKVVYGSQTLLDTTAQIVNSGAWTIEGEIIRTGNTSQEVSAEFHGAGVTLFTTAAVGVLAQTNGISTTLKMTSTAAGNGDVTNRTLVVMYYPAP